MRAADPSPRVSRLPVASLPLEPCSRRIVRAVNLRMAVLARVRDHEPRPWIARLRVPAQRMALLAQARPRHVEHVFVVGAVRIVAVEAVLTHRRMVVEERPALLRVALVADI